MSCAASLLGEIVANHYAVGELVDCRRLSLGYVNVSYVIETATDGERKKYFLREYKRGIREEEIVFEHSVIEHLVSKGFDLVAGVIATRDGMTFVKRFEGGDGEVEKGPVFYALFDFLPGEDRYTWVNPTCNDEELANAASVLARFHIAVSDLIPAGKRYEPKILHMLPIIAENVERGAGRGGRTEFDAYLRGNLDLILENINHTLQAIDEKAYESIVHQVIHCDYHPGNLKFQDSQITGLFDFDWSKVDARCFDLALAITYFCTAWEGERDGHLDLRKAALFLRAYRNALESSSEVRPLNEIELKLLPWMISASNIYVLNWTVEDFYGREADPNEYLIYLRHGVRMMRWLEDDRNRDQLQRMIAGAGVGHELYRTFDRSS